jgi:hypothetical protein
MLQTTVARVNQARLEESWDNRDVCSKMLKRAVLRQNWIEAGEWRSELAAVEREISQLTNGRGW